jgi:hypothetical protein
MSAVAFIPSLHHPHADAAHCIRAACASADRFNKA